MIYKLMIIKNNFIYFLEILVKLPVYCYRDRIFRGSSVVEQLTVNQLVVSSNLTRGAIYLAIKIITIINTIIIKSRIFHNVRNSSRQYLVI